MDRTPASSPPRRLQQDYTCFLNHLTPTAWTAVAAAETLECRVEPVLLVLYALGLRLPSELTYAAILAAVTIGWGSTVSTYVRHQQFSRVKACWKCFMKRRNTLAEPYLDRLPSLRELPECYRAVAYATEQPIDAPVSLVEFQRVLGQIPMRRSHTFASPGTDSTGGLLQGLAMLASAMQGRSSSGSSASASEATPALQILPTSTRRALPAVPEPPCAPVLPAAPQLLSLTDAPAAAENAQPIAPPVQKDGASHTAEGGGDGPPAETPAKEAGVLSRADAALCEALPGELRRRPWQGCSASRHVAADAGSLRQPVDYWPGASWKKAWGEKQKRFSRSGFRV